MLFCSNLLSPFYTFLDSPWRLHFSLLFSTKSPPLYFSVDPTIFFNFLYFSLLIIHFSRLYFVVATLFSTALYSSSSLLYSPLLILDLALLCAVPSIILYFSLLCPTHSRLCSTFFSVPAILFLLCPTLLYWFLTFRYIAPFLLYLPNFALRCFTIYCLRTTYLCTC